MTVVLAIDLGGTGLRAGLVDLDGQVTARAQVPIAHTLTPDGRAEIDPDLWWQALCQAVADLPAVRPVAVALSALTRTQVLIDAKAAPVRPAILWHDRRAAAVAAELARDHSAHGAAHELNAYHPLARLAWVAREEPDVWARVAAVLDPKDYLNARLTGRVASDPISLSRLLSVEDLFCTLSPPPASGGRSGGGNQPPTLPGPGTDPSDRWHNASRVSRPPILPPLAGGGARGDPPLAGGGTTILPPLLSPTAILGPVIALPALAGVPVVTMANDTWASALGLGAVVPGGAYALSGTTEVLGVLGTRPATADGLLTLAWGDLWHLGGPSQAGADCLAWLGEVLGIAPSAVDPLLQEARDPHPPVFLPHLAGARVPYWDDQRRGAFIGLSRSHTATDLAWAVIEGVAALNRAVLERAEAALGQPISALRVGGGAAASAAWCQTKSDMLNRPVETVATADPGLTGAAIAAAVALGHHPDLAAAQAAMVTPARRFTPDAARHQALTHGYHAYVAADAALAALTRTLGDVG